MFKTMNEKRRRLFVEVKHYNVFKTKVFDFAFRGIIRIFLNIIIFIILR